MQNTLDVSELYFSELESTASIRSAFHDIVVTNSQVLFTAFSHDKMMLGRLKDSLRLRFVDQNSLYKGLFIQAVSVFESFIRSTVTYVIDNHVTKEPQYSKLELALRNYYISNSGKALSYFGSGSINGVKYDFDKLTESLASCFNDSENYHIESRVFTISMGNCTSSRLESLFSKLLVSDDIFSKISNDVHLRKVLNETRRNNIKALIKDRLDNIIDVRNDIAHGEITRSVSKDEFEDCLQFLRGLIKALASAC